MGLGSWRILLIMKEFTVFNEDEIFYKVSYVIRLADLIIILSNVLIYCRIIYELDKLGKVKV